MPFPNCPEHHPFDFEPTTNKCASAANPRKLTSAQSKYNPIKHYSVYGYFLRQQTTIFQPSSHFTVSHIDAFLCSRTLAKISMIVQTRSELPRQITVLPHFGRFRDISFNPNPSSKSLHFPTPLPRTPNHRHCFSLERASNFKMSNAVRPLYENSAVLRQLTLWRPFPLDLPHKAVLLPIN